MKRFIVVIAATGYDHVTHSLVAGINAATAKSAQKKALKLSERFTVYCPTVEAAAFPVDAAGINALDSRQLQHYFDEANNGYNEAEAAQWRCMSAAWRSLLCRGNCVVNSVQTLYAEN